MSACPPDDVWIALAEGRLSAGDDALQGHIDECAECRGLLAGLVASQRVAPQPAAEGFVPPPQIDQYRVLRPLGRGAMGQVFLAHDTFLERAVALKFPDPSPGGGGSETDGRGQARFLTEARALARLSHPNVMAIYQVGQVETDARGPARPFLVCELVEGRSLDQAELPLPIDDLLPLALGLARGLGALHRRGVLHRDIKPANLVRDAQGEVKLIDFGLALVSDAGAGEADAAGTPRYLAPELWQGQRATPRSDVYAVGVVLFQLACGRFPHEADTREALRRAVIEEAAPPLGPLRPELDPRLCAVIDRCLERDPAARFDGGEALCRACERLARDLLAWPLPEGNPYRGLAAFQAEHRALFFGRERECADVLARLREGSLVIVAGDSGAGKSSLCQAAVLPLVQDGALGQGRRFLIAAMVPGRAPLFALRATLAPLLPGGQGASVSDDEPPALALALHRRLQAEGRGLLLFVDQLEELLTQARPDEAARFGAIIGALGARVPSIKVLCTVRGDFLTRVAAVVGSSAGDLTGGLYLLPPLGEDGLRAAITGPAERKGVVLEDALVRALLETAAGGSGLPLLQFALSELWERRDIERRSIAAAALAAIGGVAGALARHGDGVLRRLSIDDRPRARWLLLRLLTPEGLRARRLEGELLRTPEDRPVLEALVRSRLVSAQETDDGAAYEIAHEALVRGWPTLRGWLDEDGARRAALERLAQAAAEWERLGRRSEGLWSALQVAEARGVAGGLGGLIKEGLPPRERDFYRESLRKAARRRRLRVGAVTGGPLLALVLGVLAGHQGRRELDQRILAQLSRGLAELAAARGLADAARAQRQAAYLRFDAGQEDEGERAFSDARSQAAAAAEALSQAQGACEQAVAVDGRPAALRRTVLERLLAPLVLPDRAGLADDARRSLGEALLAAALLAEEVHELPRRDELLRRLALYDGDGALRRRLAAPGTLRLAVSAGMLEVRIDRYESDGGRLRLAAQLPPRAVTGTATLALPPGSYLLRATGGPGRPSLDVRLPFLLQRGEVVEADLAPPAQLPAGMVYVPPGWSLFGSAGDEDVRRTLLQAQPLHRVWTAGFLIGRHEVTYGEYLDYLRALPAPERARRLPSGGSGRQRGGVELHARPDGRYELWLQPTSTRYVAAEGERLRYPGRHLRALQDWRRLPVSGVSFEDAEAYAAWLATSGRLPGARLCDEREWERAARGADGRDYPHGARLDPDDANIDETYGRDALSFGPDEVGAHPASESPFGVADLCGNVWEWVRGRSAPVPRFRGGGFYNGRLEARSANWQSGEPTLRGIIIGLRVCAALPAK